MCVTDYVGCTMQKIFTVYKYKVTINTLNTFYYFAGDKILSKIAHYPPFLNKYTRRYVSHNNK